MLSESNERIRERGSAEFVEEEGWRLAWRVPPEPGRWRRMGVCVGAWGGSWVMYGEV